MTKDRTKDDAAADASAESSTADHATAGPHADNEAKAAETRRAEARRAEARRRRRLDEVFGDVLPTTTRDEREPGGRGGFSLEHYRASKPPHWGDKQ